MPFRGAAVSCPAGREKAGSFRAAAGLLSIPVKASHDKHASRLYNMSHHIEEAENMTTYGYIRVSTRDQNEDRQLAALSVFDISEKNLFLDKQSGKDFNRPAY